MTDDTVLELARIYRAVEAKVKAEQNGEAFKQPQQQERTTNMTRTLLKTFWVPLVIGIAVGVIGIATGMALSVTAAHCAESTMQRDAPTTRFYTPDGKSAGTASTYGNTTKFYAPNGSLVGSATHNSGRK